MSDSGASETTDRVERRTQVTIDYTQLTVRQPQATTEHDSGRRSTQSSISLGTGRCVVLRSRRDSSSKTDLNKRIDEKFRTNGCRSLNADADWQLGSKSRETRCSMEPPSRKCKATGTRNANRITTASPGRVRQTRGDFRRERRPEDLSGRLITAAHASVDSW